MSRVDEYTHDLLTAIHAGASLEEAMRDLTLRHAEHLSQPAEPVAAVAIDSCPRCRGSLLVGDVEVRCAAGCGWAGRLETAA